MKTKTFLKIAILFVFGIYNRLYAQTNISGWNVYTCMKEVKDLSLYQNNVYAATTGGLFSFDYNSPQSTIKKYTTINGLLNNDLLSISVDNNGNVWTGGFDGSINYLSKNDNSLRGISDIQTSNETSKGINSIFPYGRYMFFGTDFSVIRFDVNSLQFVDQPYIYLGTQIPAKSQVYAVHVVNDTVWAGTKFGIAFANINSYLPIQTNWADFTTNNSPLKSNQTNSITYFNGKVYFGTDSGMYYYENNVLNPYAPLYNGTPINGPIINISSAGSSIYFTTYKSSNNTFRADLSNLSNAQLIFSGANINVIKPGYNGDLVIGTTNKGVNLYRNGANNYALPNGPYSNLMFSVAADSKSNIWAVSGSVGDWTKFSGIYRYDGTSWKNYLVDDYPILGTGCCGWVNVYASRYSNTVWVSGWGNGLLNIDGDVLHRYDDGNSILKNIGGPGFVLCWGIDEDQNGKLWVLNSLVENPIVNFTDSIAYPCPGGNCAQAFFTLLAIDNYNTKWMSLHNSQGQIKGIMYFNEQANTGLHMDYLQIGANVAQVSGVYKEKNGEIWIATNQGIFIIADPSQVISNPNSIPTIYQMRIIENGLSTPLLEAVQSIAVDAVNNKWIGTSSHGLLYVSPDGSTILNRLTKSNSGLIDDRINYLCSDKNTGRLFVATQSGLCSFQTVAVQAQTDCSKITAGPNPYIIPNNNLLRISGLVENSSVKILTLSGKLVIDFVSPGGKIANWDGKDMNGNLVASGIYLIAGYNQDGTKVCTGKVAIVKR